MKRVASLPDFRFQINLLTQSFGFQMTDDMSCIDAPIDVFSFGAKRGVQKHCPADSNVTAMSTFCRLFV